MKQSFLCGYRNWEWLIILLVRVSIGLFFCISGYNKLFIPAQHAEMLKTITAASIPFPAIATWLVSGIEFLAGALLTIGFLTIFWSIIIIIDMVVAIITVQLPTLPSGLSALNWLDYFLYLPEVLYILLLFWLICSGPGKFSLDNFMSKD